MKYLHMGIMGAAIATVIGYMSTIVYAIYYYIIAKKSTYKLETTDDESRDMPTFVKEYVERIQKNNETQGKDGVYFGYGTREIATVRSILLGKEFKCDAVTMDMLISVVADTLLISKEVISTKLDAIALLICIAIKYPEDYTKIHPGSQSRGENVLISAPSAAENNQQA